jgi:membrane-associated phospholipid phosphatase
MAASSFDVAKNVPASYPQDTMFRSPRLPARASFVLALIFAPAMTRAQAAGRDTFIVTPAGTAIASADSARTDSASTPPQIRIVRPAIMTRNDLIMTAAFTGAAVALFPFDDRISHWVRRPAHLESGFVKGTMAGVEWGVEKGSLIAAAGLWGAGLATRNRTVAEMGFHTLASIAVTQQVTHVLKGAFGRSRPYMSGDSLAHDWSWGRGFGTTDRRSFPSGHTSSAFATATTLSHEISRSWPKAGRIATPLLYAGATGAGLARIYHDKHWASDVTVGALVGILGARATLGVLHGYSGNFVDRLALNTRIVPHRNGASVSFERRF